MRAVIKRTATSGQITLPPAALAALSGGDEVDVWVLRKGVVLLTESGALERGDEKKEGEEKEKIPLAGMASALKSAGRTPEPAYPMAAAMARNAPAPAPAQKKSQPIILSSDETAVVRKLLAIRFEERTVPQVAKKIGAGEKKVLDALVTRRLIEVFKNSKYKEGVYNISQKVYEAVASPMNGAAKEGGAEPANRAAPKYDIQNPETSKNENMPAVASSVRSLDDPPINSAEHLARFGYMVLNTESEAKMAMMQIQPMLKTDDVRGIRGFDKRYYVLRRSFLHQYAGLVLAQLDAGPATADKIAAALGLPSEAVSVILMIMADEGEVIEKRRGAWERA